MDLLSVENVSLGYEKNPVIRDITFGVPAGSVFGIIGPNGAGKTTLFKALSRLVKPWEGRVCYKGTDIEGIARRKFARSVAVIPQFRSVPPPFTVHEFVSLGRYPHGGRLSRLGGEDAKIIEEVLGLLNVACFRHKLVSSLSGGEMQRVFLAQGLVQSPELLLMDEPTAHLDIGQKIRTLDLMRSLSKHRGLTAVVILHDLNLAGMYCDKILMMAQGGIRAAGNPEEVLTAEYIMEVYGTPARVDMDPATSRPHIFFLPQT
jgi:iron complex transport system ATP-binding protein